MQKSLVGQILAVLFFRLLLNTGRRFVYPFAPALSRELGVPLAAITAIIATCQLTTLVGLFSGPLADRFGFRRMMRIGLVMLTIGMLLCGLADQYWLIFVGLVVASFGKVLFDPAIQAFIGHTIPFSRRGRIIGIVETAWAGSTLIGIPALGLIIDQIGLGLSFYLLAALGGISWLIINQVISDDRPTTTGHNGLRIFAALPELLRNRPAAGMLAFGFWISIANDSLFVVYGAWLERDFGLSIASLGLTTIAIGSAELLGESMTAIFADRLGLKRALIIGLLLAMLAYLILPLTGGSLWLALAGMFLVFFAYEFTIVTSFSLSTELLAESRATMMAGFYATAGIGRMIGVLLGGSLWQLGGLKAVAWTALVLTGLGLLSLLWGLHGWAGTRR